MKWDWKTKAHGHQDQEEYTVDSGEDSESGSSEITSGTSQIQEIVTQTPQYILDTDESEEDIVQAHDDAGSTNEFIAVGLHEIASTANKIVVTGEGEDISRDVIPDWSVRLAAFKEISDQKGLRGVKEKKKKRREGSVYVFVP